ncbi:Rv2175c family DNA-binding protein [Pseudokineococcus basanitobsidens]|uniref:Rv2175c family DNA-binding protein n=1 Tax=Pseudokineococcus basanitobsidens TaxID=1926649 RepID=A0ABU8RL89_9ACTN
MSTPDQEPQQDSRQGGDGTRGDVPLADLEQLVDGWMTVQEVAEHLGLALSQVRRMVSDRDLVAVRRGRPRADCVPTALVVPVPLPRLRGTAVVLADAGYSDAETLRWLFTPDPSLPGTPVEALRAEHRTTEVRRRAQALAF